jgi:hypothetical protein
LILSPGSTVSGAYRQADGNNAPQLVIESGGHTAPITALMFSSDKYTAGRID